jgi:hypothetical protein
MLSRLAGNAAVSENKDAVEPARAQETPLLIAHLVRVDELAESLF